jgi:hypothetical protein
MKKTHRIIRNGQQYTPKEGADSLYFEACLQMEQEDGCYTYVIEDYGGETSIYSYKEEGSPFCL